jgi:hypothetical protein
MRIPVNPLRLRRSFIALAAGGAFALMSALPMAAHADAAAPAASAPPAAATASPAAPTAVAAPVAPLHPEVQRALAYTVPETTCVKPDVGLSNPSAGRFERIERAQKRYVKCLEGYQQQLFGDFVFLRDSVRHGVTQPQADAIAGNLRKVHEQIRTVQSLGAVITQDQARIITTMMSGNRTMPGAENH